MASSAVESQWTFFSNYSHVLAYLAQNPGALLREVSDRVGITQRTAMRLITRLDEAGILTRSKQGRRNYYQISTGEHLRHPLEAHCTIEELLDMILVHSNDSIKNTPKNDPMVSNTAENSETQNQQQLRKTRR